MYYLISPTSKLITLPEQINIDLLRQTINQHAEQLTLEIAEYKGQLISRYVERITPINNDSALAIILKVPHPMSESEMLYIKTLTVSL